MKNYFVVLLEGKTLDTAKGIAATRDKRIVDPVLRAFRTRVCATGGATDNETTTHARKKKGRTR